MLSFAKKCVKHPTNSRFFPKSITLNVNPETRQREPFKVNFARTESYKKSAIPTCQRLLNAHFLEQPGGVSGHRTDLPRPGAGAGERVGGGTGEEAGDREGEGE